MLEVLVVDNHDSFTWNLVDYLEAAPGVRCRVITNDQRGWTVAELTAVDAVVLSPGPGHPALARDFGHCRAILEMVPSLGIPTLGVCLGHQGICAAFGGRVEPYPDPHHGRSSHVEHDGSSPLFDGVPKVFSAVRYHSLTAVEVTAPLRVTAWSGELVMAVEHEELPLYGVQFHPESAASEQGRRILANFLDIARMRRAARCSGAQNSQMRVLSAEVEFDGDLSMLQEEFAEGAPSYLLESAAPRRDEPMRSFVGVCGPHWEQVVARPAGFAVEGAGRTRLLDGNLLDWVEDHVLGWRLAGRSGTARWVLGLPYDLDHDPRSPARALLCDRTMAYDYATGRLLLEALCDDATEPEARRWVGAVARRCGSLTRSQRVQAARGSSAAYRLVLRDPRPDYVGKVSRAQEHIRKGDSYELCLTSKVRVIGENRPFAVYRSLRAASPSFFAAHVQFGESWIVSSSPERFLSVEAGRCTTEPIKGTRPRGRTPGEDLAQRNELETSEKDRAENLMIVDLARNDLRRFSQPGSVSVDRLCDVETHPTVFQLTSSISSTMRPAVRLSEVVAATFPPGSMTGAPKTRSMEILEELEDGECRGYYSGAIGYLDSDGRLDLSVLIRAVVNDGTTMTYGVGGAVTAISDPSEEFEEILAKTTALAKALGCPLPT